MKALRSLCLPALAALSFLALALLSLPTAALRAQELKPAAVLSIASVEKNLSDVVYLTRVVGMEDTGKTAQLFGNALTAGMDKTRPTGLYIAPAGTEFHAVAFVPVTNLKLLLEVHKEQVGEPKDVGGSILEIGTDRKAYVKEQSGWAFLAEKQEHLRSLPADPGQLLGDLPAKYNIAVRVLANNVPTELKQVAIDQMKAGLQQATQFPGIPGAVPNPSQADAQKQALEVYSKQIERLINDSEEILVGLSVDPVAKSVSIDANISAREGTELAKRMAMQNGLKSAFAGFLLPEATFSMLATSAISEADAAQAKQVFQSQREQILSSMALLTASAKPEDAAALKAMFEQVVNLLAESAGSTKTDQGMVVVLAPGSMNAAMGTYFPDGAALELVLADAAKVVHGKPDANGKTMELVLNVGTHGDVKLHKGAFPVTAPLPALQSIVGEKLAFVVGTSKNAAYVAVGKDSEALLKKVLDRSAAQASQPVQPTQMTISVLPIAKFYQSIDRNPLVAGLVASLEQEGGDKLLVTGTAGPRSGAFRLEVQEGLIRTVGEVGKIFGSQFGGGLPQ